MLVDVNLTLVYGDAVIFGESLFVSQTCRGGYNFGTMQNLRCMRSDSVGGLVLPLKDLEI